MMGVSDEMTELKYKATNGSLLNEKECSPLKHLSAYLGGSSLADLEKLSRAGPG